MFHLDNARAGARLILSTIIMAVVVAGVILWHNSDRQTAHAAPIAQKGSVDSEGVEWHGAHVWHDRPYEYEGDGIKIAVIDTEFKGIGSLYGNELPPESQIVSRCYSSPFTYTLNDADRCDYGDGKNNDDEHGSRTAQVVMDVAPNATLYIANPKNQETLLGRSYG